MRWLLIGCLMLPVGLFVLVGLGFLSIGMLGEKASTKFDMVGLPKGKLTESQARGKLKKALDCWTAGEKKQAITAKYPDIEFVDSDLGDGYNLLRHDIRSGWEGPDGWLVKVDMVFRNKLGGEVRLTREYEVRNPSEKGVTSIHVSLAEIGPRTKTHE